MPNMSYCRFFNTLRDLKDCQEALDSGCYDDLDNDERAAAKRLVNLCQQIANDHLNED